MPVIKSAIKKLRKDIKRTKSNDTIRYHLDRALNNAKKTKTSKSVTEAMSLVDRAVKKNLMHKNRAARVKSSLSKLAKPAARSTKSATKSIPKSAVKKAVSKAISTKKTASKATKSPKKSK